MSQANDDDELQRAHASNMDLPRFLPPHQMSIDSTRKSTERS
ncbi:hypothetical protein JMJ77_0006645 [Colletotrichum scovillei]|uniref:Uncharacterized protein n=1 Tax=Colletotrichum scovillei TaxID=1209932 RepID=A0A9P7RK94_9PEZI|nr:hypothetical protein JMJ77_0006645 [Colletotrichum scovillei]KAG7077919.1 hypothetical protein JMJ76_0015160 [Colletotrichum scovillei]KAG7084985.1 hypothetical protein JMJ78_0010415 [Colletotrichum scovillei]